MNDKFIDEAVNEFSRSIDRLAKLVRVISIQLEKELSEAEISCRVSGRVKNPASLRTKLKKQALDRTKSKKFKRPSDVFDLVGDLAAVRVMTYLESDRQKVSKIVRDVFTHRPDEADFGYEEKETVQRVKENDQNFYRATHMQIALRDNLLLGENENLNKDHCEIQITSMLAHVWNEVEHDIVYKGNAEELSELEQKAIESLGLLTKSGDNIIASLIQGQLDRKQRASAVAIHEDERFADSDKLKQFLEKYFGTKVAGQRVDFSVAVNEFQRTLEAVGWNHPTEFYKRFTPHHMELARKSADKFSKFLNRKDYKKPAFLKKSCDLLILAAFMSDMKAFEQAFECSHGMNREVAFFKRYSESLSV